MANLLSHKSARVPFPLLEIDQQARFAPRLHTLTRMAASPPAGKHFTRLLGDLEAALKDLEGDPFLVTAQALLEEIECTRLGSLARCDDSDGRLEARAGLLIGYWPGRSLATGESDVVSRGFFDVMDRPPIGLWLAVVARPTHSNQSDFEIAIVAWIPPAEVVCARAGRDVCWSGSLAPLFDTSTELDCQLRSILDRNS